MGKTWDRHFFFLHLHLGSLSGVIFLFFNANSCRHSFTRCVGSIVWTHTTEKLLFAKYWDTLVFVAALSDIRGTFDTPLLCLFLLVCRFTYTSQYLIYWLLDATLVSNAVFFPWRLITHTFFNWKYLELLISVSNVHRNTEWQITVVSSCEQLQAWAVRHGKPFTNAVCPFAKRIFCVVG